MVSLPLVVPYLASRRPLGALGGRAVPPVRAGERDHLAGPARAPHLAAGQGWHRRRPFLGVQRCQAAWRRPSQAQGSGFRGRCPVSALLGERTSSALQSLSGHGCLRPGRLQASFLLDLVEAGFGERVVDPLAGGLLCASAGLCPAPLGPNASHPEPGHCRRQLGTADLCAWLPPSGSRLGTACAALLRLGSAPLLLMLGGLQQLLEQ